MNIPATLQAGDTLAWTDSLVDYPAPTYTLKYTLYRYGQAPIAITAAASGTDHVVSVTAATSAAYAAGNWNWTAYVEAGATRVTVARGTVTIRPNLSVATSATDHRSTAQKMLDAIDAAMLSSVTSNAGVQSITIDGKSVTYNTRMDLKKLRNEYAWAVYNEKRADLIAQGLDPGGRILTRF